MLTNKKQIQKAKLTHFHKDIKTIEINFSSNKTISIPLFPGSSFDRRTKYQIIIFHHSKTFFPFTFSLYSIPFCGFGVTPTSPR
jgi:hypothetical protein